MFMCNLEKKIMILNLKIFVGIFIGFSSLEILEIKAHNFNNGGCKDHCFTFIKKKDDENKIKILKKNEQKFIREKNSCVNNSLCRG